MNIMHDTKAFGELHSAVVDMLTNRPDYKCTEEFASDLIYTISSTNPPSENTAFLSISCNNKRLVAKTPKAF